MGHQENSGGSGLPGEPDDQSSSDSNLNSEDGIERPGEDYGLGSVDADGLDETLAPIWESNEERDAEEELVITHQRDKATELESGPEDSQLQEALDGERAVPFDASEDVVSSPARRGSDHPHVTNPKASTKPEQEDQRNQSLND